MGELARTYVPGGVLIDLPHWQIDERVAATARALASRAPVIYEASFLADGVYAALEILERVRGGYILTEVKATLEVKDLHLPDVAVQLHVAQHAGLAIRRLELMHLNRECEYPDLTNLFVREDVTRRVRASLRDVPATISRLQATLAGPLPDVTPGEHCTKPYRCAFFDRCHVALPEHHVSKLYKIRYNNRQALEARGSTTLNQLLPEEFPPGPARRQVESVHAGRPIVEKGLRAALKLFRPPLAFLDFETINPPVPIWKGCTPYQQLPVQMSCHRLDQTGRPSHDEWLATSSRDSRAELASAVLEACDGARSVVAYNSNFERGVLLCLADAVPGLREELEALADRLVDLLPVCS